MRSPDIVRKTVDVVKGSKVIFEGFDVNGPLLIRPSRHGDARGWFSEVFRLDKFSAEAGNFSFVQHNQSMSAAKGTVRGLHFQIEPKAQGKLVRCLRGKIRDVAVDIRRSSLTFGQHVVVDLTAENGHQLWIPPGFAHGFATHTPDVEVFYLTTDYYSPEHDRGLLWNDSALAIDWGLTEEQAVLSDKDRKWPTLGTLKDVFA
jgi:dTDP-4-dehydrorhamnose 3,5-epimerase